MQKLSQKIALNDILRNAFIFWAGTLGFQVVFTLLYFSMMMIFGLCLFNYFGLAELVARLPALDQKNTAAFQKAVLALTADPRFQKFTIAAVAMKALLYPLNIGFYEIYRKIDEKIAMAPEDIFAGYRGINFLKFSSFGLFWGFIYLYTGALPPLNLLWILVTLFAAPLMYFMDRSIGECIKLSIKALRLYPAQIIVCCIIAGVVGYGGILFFGVGFLATFPFWNAMIYALYRAIFQEVRN